jgi:signal transduction histidine kinase
MWSILGGRLALTSPFLEEYRSLGRQAPRVERVLAVVRAFLTTSGLGAIYLDPTQPARFATFMYVLLTAYALYSIGVLAFVSRVASVTPRLGAIVHSIDLIWASALTVFSEGPVSPFFLFFLFVLLAAASRWGFRETVATAAVTVTILLVETLVSAIGPWSGTLFAEDRFEMNRVITRVAYLLLTGFLLGYLADQEKQLRAELAATADTIRQPALELGLGGGVAAIARVFLRLFRAANVGIVIEEQENRRAFLWHTIRPEPGSTGVRVRRIALDAQHRAAWLFDAPARAWWSVEPLRNTRLAVVAVDSEKWALTPASVELPVDLTDGRNFTSLAAVDFGLPAEWRGRVFLFDPAELGGSETRLHFLETLAEHVTPVLSNAFLLRRLRSRAGAAERARVARELHDGAIQTLIGIEMEAEALRRRAEREAPAVTAEVAHIQALLRQEVIALRELMQELRPVDLDAPHQLPDVLALMTERFRRDTGVAARFVSSGNTASLPLRTALEVVRIAQEGLVNVRKHSRARSVLVRLAQHNGSWTLSIEDDGRGFDFAGRVSGQELQERLLGPAIIKERARAIGGEVCVESIPGTGSRVEVTFDVPSTL